MADKKQKKRLNKRIFLMTPPDLNLILAILFLNIYGIIMIYSASYYYAETTYHYAPNHFMIGQLRYVLIGLVLMFLVSFIRPKVYKIFMIVPIVLAFGLLLMVRIPGLGHASHGAYRWIKIKSVQIQIAEPIKIFVIAFIASYFSRYKITDTKKFLFAFGLIVMLVAGIYLISNNLSTAMIVFLIMWFMLMVMHPRQKWFIILMAFAVIVVASALIAIEFFYPYKEGESFRITRIRAWMHPTNDLYSGDTAYQATQALYAIASGGFFGKGLGQSLLKFKLPEPHNDYILAIIFEELGIFGVILLTYLFVYLLYRIYKIFKATPSGHARYLTLGVFFHIALQVLLNYAVTLGFFPTMGVTLPFISAGGSSAFFTLCELGVVLGIDRQNKERLLYKEAELELEAEDPRYREIKDELREKRRQEIIRKRRAARKAAMRGQR